MYADVLITNYSRTAEVIHNQLDDMTHEECLVQPVPNGHSINWLLGHLVATRKLHLMRVGAEPVWTDKQRARYVNGSDPIGADGPGVYQLNVLLEAFDETQKRFIAGLEQMTTTDFEALNEKGQPIFMQLSYYHFHETYHIGQMTQVAAHLGKPTAYLE